ncbi:MAG: lamin tail domain-containing protein, partial [Candidatus Thermoplasmatota archaeon]
DQISQIVDIIKNAVNFCAGGIFWVFGGASYNTVEDYVSNASENFWNELKAKIKGAFSVFLDVVGGVFENITSSAFESLTMLLTPVAEMFRATIVDFLDELGALLNATITWIFTGGELTNTKFLLPMNYQNDFEFWSNDYKVALDNKSIKHERFIVDQTPDYLELESQQTIEAVDLSSWWQYYDTIYPRPSEYKLWVSIGTPQGLHHTDPKLISKTPFEVTWEIGIYGKLQFSARSETRVLLYNGSHEYVSINDSFELNISLPITIYSGWELESVNYKATNIFLTDIARSIFKIWDCAKTAIKLGFDILTKLGELIKNIISPLINFAFWIVDTIYKLFQLAIDWLRGFISDILKSIILPVVDQLKGLGAEKLEFSVFGFNFIIYIDPDSNASYNFYLNPKIDELFSILMNGSIFGIPFKLRLDAIECDSIYDIILTSGLNISGFTSKFVLDPLMTARCHFVETQLLCTNSQGNGLGFDLYFPEFEVTNTISVSVPVTPAPIPIPPLPIQASIEVGTELTYEAPVIDHVVINEFELSSSANELWLELCNPTYEDVSLNGWSISTLTGEKVTYIISSKTIPGAIPSANGYLVIPLPENFRSKSGLSGLVLRNDKGELIDRTPLCMDNYCNGSTWQRAYDCALTWIFHPSSKNGGNPNISSPAEPYLDFKALILSAIKDCFLETKYELSSEYKEELEYVLKFAKTFLRKFKERILEIIREVVVELVFYVDLIIEVIGTGVGGGLKLAFVMEGTAIAELLDWLCKAVVSYVKRLLNPNSCQTFPLPSSELPEHLFLQLEIYGKAEVLPEVLSELLPSPEAELKISFVIKVNIPTFTSFMGPDLGDWRVEFGIKVAYEHGISFVGLGKNRDLEVWLIKGAVYEISN